MIGLSRFLILLALVVGPPAAAADRFDELLQTANAARSSDPPLFAQTLATLESERASLSPGQSHHLDFLTGYQAAYSGDFDRAIALYRGVLAESADTSLVYRAGYALVNVYSITRDWTEGLVQLEETLALSDQVEDPGLRQESWVVAGVFYNQLGQYELTLDYTDRLFAGGLTGRNLCMAHSIRLEALMQLGRLEPSSPEIASGIAECERVTEPVMANFIRTNLAQLQVQNRDYRQAHDTLEGHLEEIEATGYKRLIAEVYALLSQAELGLGRRQEAAARARQALDHAGGFPLSKPTVQAYWTLKEYYKQQRDFESALDYEVRHTEAQKGILDEQSEKQLAFQLARHQVLEKNQQIELLSQENKVLQLRDQLAQETAKTSRLVLYLAIVIAVSLGFWGYFLHRSQRRLKILAENDGLTGLANRRHFSKSARELLRYLRREKKTASLILFDLDRFKRINDTYGHAAGDWVLQQAAGAVRAQGRENDLFGRIGGEEFAVLLPFCSLRDGLRFAEQCREAIERIDGSDLGPEVTLSASFGVTACDCSGYGLEKLMSDCDVALYEAKRLGRNRVVCVETPLAST